MQERVIAALSVSLIAWNLLARYVFDLAGPAAEWPLTFLLIAGSAPLLWKLLRSALQGDFGSDLLAGISILVSLVLGQNLAGVVILLMLSGGAALEDYAMRRASTVLGALAKRMPHHAHRRSAHGLEDIPLESVRVGDHLTVLPHETCPVDGEVIDGQSRMDESFLTGEPFQISKTPGSEVISGALNGDAVLVIEVKRIPADSRYAKIVQVMQQAELSRPKMRRVADRLGAWYTLVALLCAGAAWAVSHDPTRFLAVLVVATPCPLLLAIPVAILGAISVAAARGIIVKDPSMLERISTCRTMIFDKTGTLTYGRPALTEILCAEGVSPCEVLEAAASLEQYSKHPLAAAVREYAFHEGIIYAYVSGVQEKPGTGLSGYVNGVYMQVTGRKHAEDVPLPPSGTGLESIVLKDGRFLAVLRFRDVPRKESRSFIGHLAPNHGVNRIMLLSGDREAEVRYLADLVGIGEALFSRSPEEKLAIVREESRKARTLFLGDGINDAPAMQAATVGIALGLNSDVTAEASDAVIFESSLEKVDELIHIGRRMKRIAIESACGGMGVSIALMGIAAAGLLTPVLGAVAQEVIDIAAILNALRVAFPSDDLKSDGVS